MIASITNVFTYSQVTMVSKIYIMVFILYIRMMSTFERVNMYF